MRKAEPVNDDVLLYALLTLEVAAQQAFEGPVPRSWALKLALAYLCRKGTSAERCGHFWKRIHDLGFVSDSPSIANNTRGTLANSILHGIYADVGHYRALEFSEMARTGRFPSTIGDDRLLSGWAPHVSVSLEWNAADKEKRRWMLWQWTQDFDPPEQGQGDRMCGRYRDTRSWSEIHAAMTEFLGPVRSPSAAINLEARQEVRPTDPAVIIRTYEDGVEIKRARWWLVPWFHKGTLREWKLTTFNARAETLHSSRTFRDSFARRRCLISASGWYEWLGEKPPKQKYYFEPKGDVPIMFAGIWDRCETTDEGPVESCTIITQPAGAPLNAYHDRAPVVLFPEDWKRWLDPAGDVAGLLGPESADRFEVRQVDK